MRRIMIVGSSGSGKSTLAIRLGEKTRLPVIHIDRIYWSAGWTLRPHDEIYRRVESAAEKPEWIFEGNHSPSFDVRAARADTIIFLDLPRRTCLIGVMRRVLTFYGRVRPDMAPGCPERFPDWGLLTLIRNYPCHGRLTALKLLREASPRLRHAICVGGAPWTHS